MDLKNDVEWLKKLKVKEATYTLTTCGTKKMSIPTYRCFGT